MGNKQSSNNTNKSLRQQSQYLKENYRNYDLDRGDQTLVRKLSIKRRLTNKNSNHNHNQNQIQNQHQLQQQNVINRSSSSPVIAKWRLSQANSTLNDTPNNYNHHYNHNQRDRNNYPATNQAEIHTLTRSPLTLRSNNNINTTTAAATVAPVTKKYEQSRNAVVNLNRDLRSKQENLTNVIKHIDSTQPSYHTSSKLYRPDSFMANNVNNFVKKNSNNTTTTSTTNTTTTTNTTNRMQYGDVNNSIGGNSSEHSEAPKAQYEVRMRNKFSTLPASHTTHDLSNYASSREDDAFKHANKTNLIASKSKQSLSNGKLNKRFGLSPRFKRKIVETITNRVLFFFLLSIIEIYFFGINFSMKTQLRSQFIDKISYINF